MSQYVCVYTYTAHSNSDYEVSWSRRMKNKINCKGNVYNIGTKFLSTHPEYIFTKTMNPANNPNAKNRHTCEDTRIVGTVKSTAVRKDNFVELYQTENVNTMKYHWKRKSHTHTFFMAYHINISSSCCLYRVALHLSNISMRKRLIYEQLRLHSTITCFQKIIMKFRRTVRAITIHLGWRRTTSFCSRDRCASL